MLILAAFVSTQALSGVISPQELFRIADTDPTYEEIVISADLNSVTGDIRIIRVLSGKDVLYSRDVTRFAPGDTIRKYFITITNESFYADRGGRLIVTLDNQSVPLDIVRSSNHQWIAQMNGKRVRKIIAEVTRFLGIPTGINDDVPIIVQKKTLLIRLKTLLNQERWTN
ncbi:MAG: hypothetical protein A2X94_11635 [Bdellovibrionales bacterium GWB1_55_8]|nr:MAG: hypothetical protein A2X94_11635 [Bdellovibrionales bacterium GWB1_55_8]